MRLSLAFVYGILALVGWKTVGGSSFVLGLSVTPVFLLLSYFLGLEYLLKGHGIAVLLLAALTIQEGSSPVAPVLLGLSHLPLFFLRKEAEEGEEDGF